MFKSKKPGATIKPEEHHLIITALKQTQEFRDLYDKLGDTDVTV